MLNTEQQHAVDSTNPRICCLAGAGAGKTRVLLSRIDRQINEGVLPGQILALTFTNAAASEMQERFEATHPGMLSPEFRTFHSFCYGLICKDSSVRTALGYDAVPDIATEEIEKELQERAKVQCKIKLTQEKLRSRQNLTRDESRQILLFDKAFARILKQAGIITFDMVNQSVSALFEHDDPSIQGYKLQYKYIYTDEYQDADPYQTSFLFSFTHSNIFVVGDVLQNIYAFRGCTNAGIKQIANDPDWEKIKLFENYRSTMQICEYANTFSATYAYDTYRITMHSTRSGDDVVTRVIDAPDNYDAIAVSAVELLLKDLRGVSGTSAILCRTNKEVTEICSHLKSRGIEYMSHKETKASKLIECAISDEYMIGYLASYLSAAKYGEYIRLSAQHPNDVAWFLSTYKSNKDIAADSKKIMALRDLATLSIPVDRKIEEAQKVLNVRTIPVPDEDLFGNEYLKYLRGSVMDVKSNELYVGTIHSAKGLEYDNVFVPNVESYHFQLGDEEMNNLFYVAITRAKNRLFIYRV